MGSDLLAEAKKIASLRHIGIKKTKLISTPESRAVQEAKAVGSTTTSGDATNEEEDDEELEEEYQQTTEPTQ
jgi:small subunit ribosomal protein S3Ae